jgi:hypothetical protein
MDFKTINLKSMKKFELNSYYVTELTNDEQLELVGGSFWSVLGNIIGGVARVFYELYDWFF